MGAVLLALAALLQAPAATAQAPGPHGTQAPVASPAAPPSQDAPAPDAYSYNPDGRRDPFLSLLNAGPDRSGAAGRRGDGVAGMTVAEISVRGIMQSRGEVIAMVQGPDNRTYLVHGGQKLADGVVQSVTAEGLVIVQDVNDPLSLVKQRVVRKPLRSVEDAKQ
jgi:Tfp pilus assembly protein PilP